MVEYNDVDLFNDNEDIDDDDDKDNNNNDYANGNDCDDFIDNDGSLN